jgi:glycerol-3-phosphate dehydrogenase
MRKINTEIIVIGGGATGTGVARDLAMRGFQTLLVEKGDLTHGRPVVTVLHSGGRYIVKDPVALASVSKRTEFYAGSCRTHQDNGGFVITPWDDRPMPSCGRMPARSRSKKLISHARRTLANPEIVQCFRVQMRRRSFPAA